MQPAARRGLADPAKHGHTLRQYSPDVADVHQAGTDRTPVLAWGSPRGLDVSPLETERDRRARTAVTHDHALEHVLVCPRRHRGSGVGVAQRRAARDTSQRACQSALQIGPSVAAPAHLEPPRRPTGPDSPARTARRLRLHRGPVVPGRWDKSWMKHRIEDSRASSARMRSTIRSGNAIQDHQSPTRA